MLTVVQVMNYEVSTLSESNSLQQVSSISTDNWQWQKIMSVNNSVTNKTLIQLP